MTTFLKSNFCQFSGNIGLRSVDASETTEKYLNHPTFGLLYSVCLLEDNQELFTTLYAMRLFFLVTTSITSIRFEPISRSDARLLVENRLRQLQRTEQSEEYNRLQALHQKTF